jgi:ADP-ribosyl-[dinitrogen reductase] hydrolase
MPGRFTGGQRFLTPLSTHAQQIFPTTVGSSRRCRQHGLPSQPHPSRPIIRYPGCSVPIICAWRSTPPFVAAMTPTPLPPSPGGLPGAVYGASAVPGEWRRLLHGWPGLTTRDLVALATRIVKADKSFSYDIDPMIPVRHPHDDGVWLGNVTALQALPPGVDTIVSLCRVPDDDLPVGVEQIDVRLIDEVGQDASPNLDFVLTDTVRLIEQLRDEGRTVLVHCVAAQSRTPTVAALYGARRQGISGKASLREVTSVLPDAYPNSDFGTALQRLAP